MRKRRYEDTPVSQRFLAEYKARLLARFDQIEIYIVSYPLDIR